MTRNTKRARVVLGLFSSRKNAELALACSLSRGYSLDELSVAVSNRTRLRYFPAAQEDSVGTDAAGRDADPSGNPPTLAAVLTEANSIAIPGVEVTFAGALAATLARAGPIGSAGGLTGALRAWHVPLAYVARYRSGVATGRILFGVHARSLDDARYLEERWRGLATDVHR